MDFYDDLNSTHILVKNQMIVYHVILHKYVLNAVFNAIMMIDKKLPFIFCKTNINMVE